MPIKLLEAFGKAIGSFRTIYARAGIIGSITFGLLSSLEEYSKNRSDKFTQEFIEGNPEAYLDSIETLKREDRKPAEYEKKAAWAKSALARKYDTSYENYKLLREETIASALKEPFGNNSLNEDIGSIIAAYAS